MEVDGFHGLSDKRSHESIFVTDADLGFDHLLD